MATSIGIYQKPFFHEHSIFLLANGKLHAEFMNVPDLGFFVHLAKGDKRLRIPYTAAVWICEQKSKLGDGTISSGASEEVIYEDVTVTRHMFRFYFPLSGYVATSSGEEPWTELTIAQGKDGEENRIVLTQTEYGEFKRWVLRVLDERYDQAKTREFDHGLFLVGSNLERGVRCELCLQMTGPPSSIFSSPLAIDGGGGEGTTAMDEKPASE